MDKNERRKVLERTTLWAREIGWTIHEVSYAQDMFRVMDEADTYVVFGNLEEIECGVVGALVMYRKLKGESMRDLTNGQVVDRIADEFIGRLARIKSGSPDKSVYWEIIADAEAAVKAGNFGEAAELMDELEEMLR
jgi:hypothetical protein